MKGKSLFYRMLQGEDICATNPPSEMVKELIAHTTRNRKPTTTPRKEMIQLLEAKFGMKLRTSEEFYGTSEGKGIWDCSTESMLDYKGNLIYDNYNTSKKYDCGVLVTFENYLRKHGWYPEWYDSGTMFFYPID